MNIYRKMAKWAVLCTAFAVLGACANISDRVILHGLGDCNPGNEEIYDVAIKYGDIIVTSKKMRANVLHCPTGSINNFMKIPETMSINWRTADGVLHKQIIPVKSRINKQYYLRDVNIEFYGDKVVVKQFLSLDEPWALGRDFTLPLYP
jgi:hypothetical protein